MSSQDHVRIFDTTLRDGEQSPGATMTMEEKLRIARMLERLGVDVIEAGFAAASPGEVDSIRRISDEPVPHPSRRHSGGGEGPARRR